MNETHYFDYLTTSEKENVKLTSEQFGREIGLFRVSFNLLAEMLDEIFPTCGRGSSLIDLALLPLTHHFLMSMKARHNLVMKGYYHEAMIIYRNAIETLLLCIYVSQNQGQALEWLKGSLSIRRVRSELGFASPVYREVYRYLSDYVHMNVPSIVSFTEIRLEKERRSIHAYYVPRFNKDYTILLLPICAPLLIFILADKFDDRLSVQLKNKISKFKQEIVKEWERYLAFHPKTDTGPEP